MIGDSWQTVAKKKPLHLKNSDPDSLNAQFAALGLSTGEHRFRNREADALHLMLCQAFNGFTKERFTLFLNKAKQYLEQSQSRSLLLEQRNSSNFSHLDDLLRLPAKFAANPAPYMENRIHEISREDIMLGTLNMLLPFYKSLPDQKFQSVLSTPSHFGSTTLKHAIDTGLETVVKEILKIYEPYPLLLEEALRRVPTSDAGAVGVLQASINTSNYAVFKIIWDLLQLPQYKKALTANFENITRDGFNILLQTLSTKVLKISIEILDFLARPENFNLQTHQLKQFTKHQYGVLQSVLCTSHPELLAKVLKMLQHPSHREIFIANLQRVTLDKFSCLQTAIKHGLYQEIWALPLLHEQLTLYINLNTITSPKANSLSVLDQALLNHNPAAVRDITDKLKKLPDIAATILSHKTSQGFSTLQLSLTCCLTPGPINPVTLVWDLLNTYPHFIDFNLANLTDLGCSTLHLAASVGLHLEFVIDNISPELLSKQLTSVTPDGYTVLYDAIGANYVPNVVNIIGLSEKHLAPTMWQAILRRENRQTILIAASKNEGMFTNIVEAIHKAFQADATRILQEMSQRLQDFYDCQDYAPIPSVQNFLTKYNSSRNLPPKISQHYTPESEYICVTTLYVPPEQRQNRFTAEPNRVDVPFTHAPEVTNRSRWRRGPGK